MKLMKSIIAMVVAVAAMIGNAGESAEFRLDTMDGTRIARAVETIAYSTEWNNGNAASVAVDGVAIKEANAPASGDVVWNAAQAGAGMHTLTHASGGVTLTALFEVLPPPLTLTAESADWSLGSITLRCEDGDLDGTAHLNPQYYDKSKKQWCDIDRDDLEILKPVVETDASGNKLLVARIKDTRFAQRNNGVGTVSYRVADESGRASECSTRQRHALFVAVSEYADSSVSNLGNPSPKHEVAVIRSAYERYGDAGGFIKTCEDNPTKANALTWLEIMSESVTQPGDIFLFCFAGHGSTGFLCCHDYDKQNKEKGGITTNELFRCLTSFRDGIGLVSIIYCCNADGMFIQDNDSLNGGRIGWIFSSRTGENTIGGSLTDIVFSEGWFNGRADELNGEYGSGNGDGYVTFDELGKWGYDWTRANNYSGNNQHIEPQNTFILMNIVAGKVPSNSKPDTMFKWLAAKATSLFTASNGDVDAAAAMTAANGCRTVGECYELGIDPEDPNDDLKIAEFKMKDGKPEITLNHTKDGSGNSFEDRVKILGKAELTDAEWQEVPPEGNPAHRFFTVGVEMP